MVYAAFCGAGGTGKSTVASAIGNNIPSPVDALRKQFYGADAKFGEFEKFSEIDLWQTNVLYSQMAIENYNKYIFRNSTKSTNLIPIERSTVDYAAYFLNQAERFMKSQKNFAKVQDYVTRCIEYANSNYDFIVYFPTGKFIPADMENSSKERTLKSISKTDKYINLLLKRITIPVLRLRATKLNSRIDEIMDFAENNFSKYPTN